jgi:catechol 2,3-dioxygenase-like lactoylglutathione lyase family enzyme
MGDGGGMTSQEFWFHHVGVSVADMDGSIDWWQRMLGFSLLRRYWLDSIPAEIAMLANGAVHVELLCSPDARPASPERRVPDDDLKTCGNKHVAFSVADVRGLAERLRARGVDVVWIKDLPGGRSAAFIRDNEDNLIELVQFPKVDAPEAFVPDA